MKNAYIERSGKKIIRKYFSPIFCAHDAPYEKRSFQHTAIKYYLYLQKNMEFDMSSRLSYMYTVYVCMQI